MGMGLKITVYVVLGLAALTVVLAMLRSHRGVRAILLTAVQGVAAICAVNLLGLLSGVNIALNWYSVSVGVLFGTPGVIGILLLNTLFR